MYTCYIKSFKILASFLAEQTGLNVTWSKIPADTFSHDVAQITMTFVTYKINQVFFFFFFFSAVYFAGPLGSVCSFAVV